MGWVTDTFHQNQLSKIPPRASLDSAVSAPKCLFGLTNVYNPLILTYNNSHGGSQPGMPVQNSNSKMFACPDLPTKLLQILILTALYILLSQKGQFLLQPCLRRLFVRKRFGFAPKKSKLRTLHRNVFLNKKEVFRHLSKRQAWRVLAKSLYNHMI